VNTTLTGLAEWQALRDHGDEIGTRHLRDLFGEDGGRAERLSASAAGVHMHFGLQRITPETVTLLARLAQARGLPGRTAEMFSGAEVNRTERRPALHVALRMPRGRSLLVGGRDVVADVHSVLTRMRGFVERVRSGEIRGAGGRPFRTVVSIGIGGSYLGPALACDALHRYTLSGLDVRFVSSVDPDDLTRVTAALDASETLVLVSSKSFATPETLANAAAARRWLDTSLGPGAAIRRHLAAVTAVPGAAASFGIDEEMTFELWDWVGGRTSLCSAVGLPTMLAVGPDRFDELRDGFHRMDEHFLGAAAERSLPALSGLLAIWNRSFLGAPTRAVLPYASALRRLPAYLQQLEMESNGKSVIDDGTSVELDTAPVVWGEAGTEGQHSFHQLLHQGTTIVPCDLVVVDGESEDDDGRRRLLQANAIAQAAALAFGRTEAETRAAGVPDDLVPHCTFPGNRPSTTLVLDGLTPSSLGALLALFEHAVFTQAVIWGVDPFDQWGVELGKSLAGPFDAALAGTDGSWPWDDATGPLVRQLRRSRR
jgi:glucose-6-phosphate isomerase